MPSRQIHYRRHLHGVFLNLMILSACGSKGGASNDDVVMQVSKASESGTQGPSPDGTASTATVNNSSNTSTQTSNNCPSSGGSITPFTFDEAKSKCASCHGASNSEWGTGNGTLDEWRAVADRLRTSVVNDTMPMPPFSSATNDKARFLAFLDQLTGTTPSTESCTSSTSGTGAEPQVTPTPSAIVYNFDSAKTFCVYCHSSQATNGRKKTPYLDTEQQWKELKNSISEEVESEKMPKDPITLSTEQRAALMRYIDSL